MREASRVPAAARRRGRRSTDLAATADLVVEEVLTGFCGAVVACDKQYVTLEDRHRAQRMFSLGPWVS